MDKYKDIRPFHDEEIPQVASRLAHDKDFLDLIAGIRLPKIRAVFPPMARWIAKQWFNKKVRSFKVVTDIQDFLHRRVDELFTETVTELSVSGVEDLDKYNAYLFISNHRDIAMDPVLVSYVLRQQGLKSTRNAFGDNLMENEYVGDVMRVNKGFIVKRSIQKPRELLMALRTLSQYIRHSITADKEPVWLAQRSGRAKDGIDATEPSIIKMLAMSGGKQETLGQSMNALNIVPVAISYEWDPCDLLKAKELSELEQHGEYEKQQGEDTQSVFEGIRGYKGRVHLSFGALPEIDTSEAFTPEHMAELVDECIINDYILFPSNYFAYKELHGEYPQGACLHNDQIFDEADFEKEKQLFEKRLASCPTEHREWFLKSYANPIEQKLKREMMSV